MIREIHSDRKLKCVLDRMDYNQQYIDTGYCELSMPPAKGPDGKPTFALDPNHLHIWPRHTFMLIALPNPDFTFTCTLFMPFQMFEDIKTNEQLMAFFEEHFNDAIPLIGEASLKSDFFSNPRGALVTVKASPHNYQDKSVIIGDAAHAMVPFYGQGMNCGFQDVEVLHQILDRHHIKPLVGANASIAGLKEALDDYSSTRVKDAYAICDLAMYNHYEMRHAVTSIRYLARKKLEGAIHYVFPSLVIPLYTMVSFTTMPYSKAIERWHRQSHWLNVAMISTGLATVSVAAAVGLKHRDQFMASITQAIESVRKLI
jgi:kynurenine 3-monooxygenase